MTRDDTGIARKLGRQHIVPAAGAAARAVFVACGCAPGWAHWTTRRGQHVGVTMHVFAGVLDKDPGAVAQELFHQACRLGWHEGADIKSIEDGAVDTGAMWHDLPPAVRAAYQTFRQVYLEMWALVDEAERQEGREGHTSAPEGRAVSPTGRRALGAEPDHGGGPDEPKIVLMSRDPSKRRPRSEAAKVAATVHDARQRLKRADKKKSGR